MKKNIILPDYYNDEYYLNDCDGYKEFLSNDQKELPERLRYIWNVSDIKAGMKVLDVGCGRGELLNKCIKENIISVGIDYSKYGINLARKYLYENNKEKNEQILLIQSDVKYLPLISNNFDRIIMSDVIEHIEPKDVVDVLLEIRRVLKVNGKLIIHTMPNLLYYRFGYPLFRFFQLIMGNKLPKNPRDRFRYAHFHINEQTPNSLKSILKSAGFKPRIWLYDYRSYFMYPQFMRISMRIASNLPVLNNLFCDDIFAIATKI